MINEILDNIVDEVVLAIKEDFSNPETIELIKEKLDDTIIHILGVNIRHPFIYPYYNKIIQQYQNQVIELLGVVVSDPPNSIDTSKEFIKEEISSKVDSFADKLKKKLQKENI